MAWGVVVLISTLLVGCTHQAPLHPVRIDEPMQQVEEAYVKLLESGNVLPAQKSPVAIAPKIGGDAGTTLNRVTSAELHSSATDSDTYLHFSDPDSCIWNPYICSSSFVAWPGYIQNLGGSTWGYVWMSHGPGGNLIPHGTTKHYHIVGMFDPSVEPNPKHSAMFGNEWLAVVMKRDGALTNFDLTEIKVKEHVPIQLWFKDHANRWWYWRSIAQGWWALPGALNIQEVHITSASRRSADRYSVDDIKVAPH